MKRKRKPAPNAALIQALINTAVKVCDEKGQVSIIELPEGNAQLIGHAMHLAVSQGKLVKLGKQNGRFIYGKPKETTCLNWCGIYPFNYNLNNVAGGYRL